MKTPIITLWFYLFVQMAQNRPLVIILNWKSTPSDKFLQGLTLCVQEQGQIDEIMMKLWLEKVQTKSKLWLEKVQYPGSLLCMTNLNFKYPRHKKMRELKT